MTEDELKQFTELAKKYEPANRDTVTAVIRESAHEVFQEINDGGRAAANRDNQAKLDKATTDLATATTERDKAVEDLKAVGDKIPAAAELRKTYEEDLRKANDQFAVKEVELKNQLKAERHRTVVNSLVDKLVFDHAIDREYAQTIIAQRQDINARISVDEGNKTTVYKEGTTDIPLVAPNDDTTVIDLLATQVAAKVEPKWKTSKVKRGSNNRGSGGEEAVDQGDATEYDAIRKQVQERNDSARDSNNSRKSGHERLAGRR